MPRITWALAAVAGVAATLLAGRAEAQCPLSTRDALTALDPAIARNSDDQSAWRVTGLTMMNRTVPYIVIERHEGRISTLYYRLGRDTVRFDRETASNLDRVPPDMEARFRSLYLHNADCDAYSCIGSADIGYGLELLEAVHMGTGWFDVADHWTGNALAQVRADQDPADAVSRLAVYLSCRYNAIDRGEW